MYLFTVNGYTVSTTIRDVAQQAGVSVATVLGMLNHLSAVHVETRKLVLKAIRASGYTCNAVARSLTIRKTLTIRVIVPAITNPVFALSTRRIQEVSTAHDYSILLGNSDYSGRKEERLIKVFKESGSRESFSLGQISAIFT